MPAGLGAAGAAAVKLLAFAAVISLIICGLYTRPQRELILHGLNDFASFYTAGSLAGHGDIYDTTVFQSRQEQLLGYSNPRIQYVRLPFYAVFLWPLALMPYAVAYGVWQGACVTALFLFLRLWPYARRPAFYICCVFIPLAVSIANGQDLTFLLAALALCILLQRRGQPFAAGLVFSLCAIKPHLLLFVPVVLILHKAWRLMAGFACGGFVLALVSTAVAGLNWPVRFFNAIRNPAVHAYIAHTSLMAALLENQSSLAAYLPVAALFALALAAVWIISRKTDFATGLSASLAAGTVCGFHVYLQDYTLLLPSLLIIVDHLFEV